MLPPDYVTINQNLRSEMAFSHHHIFYSAHFSIIINLSVKMLPWSLRFYNFLTVDASKAMPVAQLYAYVNALITIISEE